MKKYLFLVTNILLFAILFMLRSESVHAAIPDNTRRETYNTCIKDAADGAAESYNTETLICIDVHLYTDKELCIKQGGTQDSCKDELEEYRICTAEFVVPFKCLRDPYKPRPNNNTGNLTAQLQSCLNNAKSISEANECFKKYLNNDREYCIANGQTSSQCDLSVSKPTEYNKCPWSTSTTDPRCFKVPVAVVDQNAIFPSVLGTHQCGNGGKIYMTIFDFGCRGAAYSRGDLNPIIDIAFAIFRFMSKIVGLIIIASVIIAGIQYTSSRGEPQPQAAAMRRIFSAGGALLMYIFMFALATWLIPGGLFGV
jgi:hypothetical protein